MAWMDVGDVRQTVLWPVRREKITVCRPVQTALLEHELFGLPFSG